jgi:hypothetical protein
MKRCWGPEEGKHVDGCSKSKPKCRWRRPPPCCCGAYHYPHRYNSGACRVGCWAELDRPMRGGLPLAS